MVEFCHNVEEYLQPHERRNPGGDCFACTLHAIIKHFYPEENTEFNKTWDYFRKCYMGETEKRALGNTWSGMNDAIIEANRDETHNFRFEYRYEYVYPKVRTDWWSHGWGLEQGLQECTYRLEGWLKSGWLAIIEMQLNPTGIDGKTPEGNKQHTDHFAFIDGIRYGWKYREWGDGSRVGDFYTEAHVVCSAKGKRWVSYDDLMRKHGVGAWLLIRKDVLKEITWTA
jgi:hypothetical protein